MDKVQKLITEIVNLGDSPSTILYPAFILRDWLAHQSRDGEAHAVQRLLNVMATECHDYPCPVGKHSGEKRYVLRPYMDTNGKVMWRDQNKSKVEQLSESGSVFNMADLLTDLLLGKREGYRNGESVVLGAGLVAVWTTPPRDKSDGPVRRNWPEWRLDIEMTPIWSQAIIAATKILMCYKPNLGTIEMERSS